MSKNDVVLFMAEIIHCSAQLKSQNERIEITAKSDERFLDVKGLRWEKIEIFIMKIRSPLRSS